MTFSGILKYLKNNYVISISGFIVLACLGSYVARNGQVSRLEANYDDSNMRRGRVLKNFKYASDLKEDLEAMRILKADAEAWLFLSENLAVNQRYFYQIESSAGVKLQGLQQSIKPLPSGKASKKARKKAAKAKYRGISYGMRVIGTYEQVLGFMKKVEGGSAFVRLENFAIASIRGSSLVSLQLEIEVLGVKS